MNHNQLNITADCFKVQKSWLVKYTALAWNKALCLWWYVCFRFFYNFALLRCTNTANFAWFQMSMFSKKLAIVIEHTGKTTKKQKSTMYISLFL